MLNNFSICTMSSFASQGHVIKFFNDILIEYYCAVKQAIKIVIKCNKSHCIDYSIEIVALLITPKIRWLSDEVSKVTFAALLIGTHSLVVGATATPPFTSAKKCHSWHLVVKFCSSALLTLGSGHDFSSRYFKSLICAGYFFIRIVRWGSLHLRGLVQ